MSACAGLCWEAGVYTHPVTGRNCCHRQAECRRDVSLAPLQFVAGLRAAACFHLYLGGLAVSIYLPAAAALRRLRRVFVPDCGGAWNGLSIYRSHPPSETHLCIVLLN
jgi:hypothetical protein